MDHPGRGGGQQPVPAGGGGVAPGGLLLVEPVGAGDRSPLAPGGLGGGVLAGHEVPVAGRAPDEEARVVGQGGDAARARRTVDGPVGGRRGGRLGGGGHG